MGEHDYTNLEQAQDMALEIERLQTVKKHLKAAFHKHAVLDGGQEAVDRHPLWIEANERIKELEEQLLILI